jgi:hypothetical protein
MMNNTATGTLASESETAFSPSSASGRSKERSVRTDSHKPSTINPTEYEFVSFDYFGGSDLGAIMALQGQREIFRAHMATTGGKYAVHQNSGTCHICGANALYICRWYHAKNNEYIMTGEDCASKLDMSYGDMNYFRKAIGNALEAQAGKKKALATLEQAGIGRAWELYLNPVEGREEGIIVSIITKLVKYGNISEKQVSFISTLLNRIDNRPALEAARKAEEEAAADCPTGRVKISGTVLAVKVVEGFRGDVTKILVKSDTGFKVWGSRFSITGMDGGVQKDQHV